MKSILLTTTALVAFAGAAAADGHTSFSFSGTATAGVAREGDTANNGNAQPVGDWNEYAEVNTTATGTVATDMGLTFSAAISVDAGQGYDFADDDGFDSSTTQGGSVGFDNVVVDAGAYGKLTINPDDIEHLVDDDDDASADVLYTNDFGVAALSFAADVDAGDTDDTDPADVQWSAKVEAPVADIATVYGAFDEEGGNVFGGSATVAPGLTVSASSKIEAAEELVDGDRSNTIGASYTVSGLTVGAEWDSIEDGNQWSVNGSYTMDAITVAASTDEAEEWEVTGSYALSDNASLEAGVNYTEDAFVGVSFSF